MSNRNRAFTLVELLLVIAVLFVLVGLLVVSLRGARNAANRTESSNALRQMMAGYSAYSADNRQTLMPGYVDASLIGDLPVQINLRPRMADGEMFASANDISSYVWRLAPYLDHEWRTMMVDYRNPSLMIQMNQEHEQGTFGPGGINAPPTEARIGIASVPSFGLNSIFVGGDSSHGGANVWINSPFRNPPPQRLAAQRLSEVRNPSQLIVFGPVAAASDQDLPPGQIDPYLRQVKSSWIGYPELRAPALVSNADWSCWSKHQWQLGDKGRVAWGTAVADGFRTSGVPGTVPVGVGGLPIVRWGTTQYPVGHLDGSTEMTDLAAIAADMRRWSPFVTGIDAPLMGAYGGSCPP